MPPYDKELSRELNLEYMGDSKLVPNLLPKNNTGNLKLYQSLGVKIQKIRQILKYNQSAWLKPYMDFQRNLHKNVNNKFAKDIMKFLRTWGAGHAMEEFNRLVMDDEEYRWKISNLQFLFLSINSTLY